MSLANLVRPNVYTSDVDLRFQHCGVLAPRLGAARVQGIRLNRHSKHAGG